MDHFWTSRNAMFLKIQNCLFSLFSLLSTPHVILEYYGLGMAVEAFQQSMLTRDAHDCACC